MQSTRMNDPTGQKQQLLSVVPHTLDAVEGHAWAATTNAKSSLFLQPFGRTQAKDPG